MQSCLSKKLVCLCLTGCDRFHCSVYFNIYDFLIENVQTGDSGRNGSRHFLNWYCSHFLREYKLVC